MDTNTKANITLAKGCYEALGRKEFNAFQKIFDRNIEWIEPNVPGLWFQGTHRGPDAVLKNVVEPAFERITDFRVEVSQVFGAGDHVIVLGRFSGRGKTTGAELSANTAHVWTFRDGKAIRFQAYHDITNWQRALGISQYEAERLAA
jgi:uncharacterized protein